jgi:hypothetical protein
MVGGWEKKWGRAAGGREGSFLDYANISRPTGYQISSVMLWNLSWGTQIPKWKLKPSHQITNKTKQIPKQNSVVSGGTNPTLKYYILTP